MELDVNLRQQTSSDNLPNQPEDQMLPALSEIRGAYVNNGASDRLRRCDDDIVVLGNPERIEGLPGLWFIQDPHIDCIRNGIIDKFAQDQPIFALIE